jgi:hypothetical protein
MIKPPPRIKREKIRARDLGLAVIDCDSIIYLFENLFILVSDSGQSANRWSFQSSIFITPHRGAGGALSAKTSTARCKTAPWAGQIEQPVIIQALDLALWAQISGAQVDPGHQRAGGMGLDS